MTIHQKRESDLHKFVADALEALMPAAVKDYRDWKRQCLKDNHRFWQIETPYDSNNTHNT